MADNDQSRRRWVLPLIIVIVVCLVVAVVAACCVVYIKPKPPTPGDTFAFGVSAWSSDSENDPPPPKNLLADWKPLELSSSKKKDPQRSGP